MKTIVNIIILTYCFTSTCKSQNYILKLTIFGMANDDSIIIKNFHNDIIFKTQVKDSVILIDKFALKEPEPWYFIKFKNGPQFEIIIDRYTEMFINLNKEFDFENKNPKINNSPYTIELWNLAKFNIEFGKIRQQLKINNIAFTSVLEQINEENNFQYLSNTALKTENPIIAYNAFARLYYSININEFFKNKSSTIKLIGGTLRQRFAKSKLIQENIN